MGSRRKLVIGLGGNLGDLVRTVHPTLPTYAPLCQPLFPRPCVLAATASVGVLTTGLP